VRRTEVAKLEFPLLRTQVEFETGAVSPTLAVPQDDMRWAQHWVFLFPLWHGTMPALLKGFLEHIFRPGFAMEYKKDAAGDRDVSRLPKRLLAGRSARIVVTMGMPVLLYRWYFGAYGLRSFERSMLSFAGVKPTLLTRRNVHAGSRKCAGMAGGAIDVSCVRSESPGVPPPRFSFWRKAAVRGDDAG
jgi:putative NADPH-quinone reductase